MDMTRKEASAKANSYLKELIISYFREAEVQEDSSGLNYVSIYNYHGKRIPWLYYRRENLWNASPLEVNCGGGLPGCPKSVIEKVVEINYKFNDGMEAGGIWNVLN